MRLYEPVWRLLKKEGYAQLLVKHPRLVSRVRRGVMKEKDEDVGFKLLNDGKFRLRIKYDPNTGIMSFTLSSIEVELGLCQKVRV